MISILHEETVKHKNSKHNFLNNGLLLVQLSNINGNNLNSDVHELTIIRIHLSAEDEITCILTTTIRIKDAHHNSNNGKNWFLNLYASIATNLHASLLIMERKSIICIVI